MAMPGMGGGLGGGFGGGGAMAGMTEQQIQEQKMIKMVRPDTSTRIPRDHTKLAVTDIVFVTDVMGRAGIVYGQISHFWSHGFRSGRNVWAVHVECKRDQTLLVPGKREKEVNINVYPRCGTTIT